MEYYYYNFTCEVCYERVTAKNHYNDFYNSHTTCESCGTKYCLNGTKLISYYTVIDGYVFSCNLKDNVSSVGKSHRHGGTSYIEWIANFDEPMNPKELMKRIKTILVFS